MALDPIHAGGHFRILLQGEFRAAAAGRIIQIPLTIDRSAIRNVDPHRKGRRSLHFTSLDHESDRFRLTGDQGHFFMRFCRRFFVPPSSAMAGNSRADRQQGNHQAKDEGGCPS